VVEKKEFASRREELKKDPQAEGAKPDRTLWYWLRKAAGCDHSTREMLVLEVAKRKKQKCWHAEMAREPVEYDFTFQKNNKFVYDANAAVAVEESGRRAATADAARNPDASVWKTDAEDEKPVEKTKSSSDGASTAEDAGAGGDDEKAGKAEKPKLCTPKESDKYISRFSRDLTKQ
jgi:hypothetical protein